MNKDLGKESKIGIMCATARELAPYLSVMLNAAILDVRISNGGAGM